MTVEESMQSQMDELARRAKEIYPDIDSSIALLNTASVQLIDLQNYYDLYVLPENLSSSSHIILK